MNEMPHGFSGKAMFYLFLKEISPNKPKGRCYSASVPSCMVMWKGQKHKIPALEAELAGPRPPVVLMVARRKACLYNNIHTLLYIPLFGDIPLPRSMTP